MDEILAKKTFSPKTEKVYLSIIKRLTKLGFKYPSKKAEKVEYVKEFFSTNKMDKASTRLDLLNLVIVLRSIQELPCNKLKDYRGELAKERVSKNIGKMNELKDKLMSVQDYQSALLKAYEGNEYVKFIVGYLMFHFGCRNADCDVEIVNKKGAMTNDKQNYLLLSKGSVTWYRNNYKTVKSFGPQSHVITDAEFISAVKKQGTGRLFAEGQLSNAIRKVLINGMLESSVFKMLIDAAYDKKDTAEINRLSKSRGTSINTIKSFYNVNEEEQIIRQL